MRKMYLVLLVLGLAPTQRKRKKIKTKFFGCEFHTRKIFINVFNFVGTIWIVVICIE